MGVEDFINIIDNVKNIDGKIIGEDAEIIKVDLAKDNRQAWVNHLADQYLKHETLDIPPEEYKITKEDLVKELVKTEIKKIFDNG